jgi:alkylhydroperoxidase/carboxymuconolactone decarboxylase family protein YurZ
VCYPPGRKSSSLSSWRFVKQCDGRIVYHAEAAARTGATADEAAEALIVALLRMEARPACTGP